MAQQTYRANLAASTIPFVSTLFGRSVIIPGPDQNFIRQLYSPVDPDKDIGVPQAYYLHNVYPTPQGFASIGYEKQSSAPAGDYGISNSQLVIGADGAKAYIVTSSVGILAYKLPGKVFTLILPLAAPYNTSKLTVAVVAGTYYFYVANLGCYTYDPTSGAVTPVVLIGLTAALILGITAANGYLLAFTSSTVVWSSLINPLDFAPSLATGAGGGSVENIKGIISTLVSTTNGILVCSDTNIVIGIYSGNARYPYNWVEATGSGGVVSQELIAYDTNTGDNFVWTSFGLQAITSRKANLIFSDLTDFLAGQIFEDFDEDSLTFSVTQLSSALLKKLTLISARYLVISYGITELTHAILYDLALKRFGKFKFTHTDCFEYELLDQTVADIPKKSIGFLTSTGEIYTVNFNQAAVARNGVLLLGKYQYVRSRLLTMDGVSLESVESGFDCNVYLCTSLDGKSLGEPTALTQILNSPRSRDYGARATGINHSLILTGAFSLDSVILVFHINGHM